ncbi:MAG: hypothetical protein K2M47_04790 [Clostridiales bacterium]|nr:hypothetical protein [Clostridiales bacterium]
MKKFKVFLALIFSLACMFSLVACGGNGGYYVDDSLDVDMSYYYSTSYGGHVSADVEFQVYISDEGRHEISYTLIMYYNGSQIESETFTQTLTSDGKENVDVSKYWGVDYDAPGASEYDFDVGLTNIKVKKETSTNRPHVGLAIGFGVAGGLMLVGIVALYVCLNKKGDKQQAA